MSFGSDEHDRGCCESRDVTICQISPRELELLVNRYVVRYDRIFPRTEYVPQATVHTSWEWGDHSPLPLPPRLCDF